MPKSSICLCLATIIGIVLGIIVAVLYFFFTIPFIVTAIWIVFGTAALFLTILVLFLLAGRSTHHTPADICICRYGACLLLSALGAMLFSTIALALALLPATIGLAILIFIIASFYFITLFTFYLFIKCYINKICGHDCID